jgi:excisionase family DNA binding protein
MTATEPKKKRRVSPPGSLLVWPEEAAELLGVGRTKLYELMDSGEIPFVWINGRGNPGRKVARREIDAYIRRNTVSKRELGGQAAGK